MELKQNQAALILEIGEDGDITVNVNAEDMNGIAGKICVAMAKKLLSDESFQVEIMGMVGEE